MSQEQKAIYQERAALALHAAREAEKVAAQLYSRIEESEGQEESISSVYDEWLEMVNSSAFWTREWLEYLDMMKGL